MAEFSIAERQWISFCSNVVSEWFGSWTFWDPHTGEINRSFKCIRSFKALNEDKSIVEHRNIGMDQPLHPDHSGPWKIRKEDTDDKGFCHPANPQARAMFHSNGGGVWATRQITGTDAVAFEIFLCRGDHRCSVIISYNASKELRSFGIIREKQDNAQTELWSPSTELRESFPLSAFGKDFMGIEKTLDSNLQSSLVSDCKWDKDFWQGTKGTDDSENLLRKFLPDTICLSCPKHLSTKSFTLRACVLFTNEDGKELQELTLTYANGHLQSIKQGLYY